MMLCFSGSRQAFNTTTEARVRAWYSTAALHLHVVALSAMVSNLRLLSMKPTGHSIGFALRP